MTVNAFAIGKHSVVLTKGAIETFSESELKGMIVHQFGHIVHGHTMSVVLNTVGNGIFSLGAGITRIFIYMIELTILTFEKSIILKILFTFFKLIFDVFLVLFLFMGESILSMNSKQQELEADRFVYDYGYGSELVDALYLLQKMNMSQKMKLSQKVKASHPILALRIGKLENLIEGQKNLLIKQSGKAIKISKNTNVKYSNWKDLFLKLEETNESIFKLKYLDSIEYKGTEYIIISKNKGKRDTVQDLIIIKGEKLPDTTKKYYVVVEDEKTIETVFDTYILEKVDKILL